MTERIVDKTATIMEVLQDDEAQVRVMVADHQEGINAILNIPRAEAGGPEHIGQLRRNMRIKFQLVNGMHAKKLEIAGNS